MPNALNPFLHRRRLRLFGHGPGYGLRGWALGSLLALALALVLPLAQLLAGAHGLSHPASLLAGPGALVAASSAESPAENPAESQTPTADRGEPAGAAHACALCLLGAALGDAGPLGAGPLIGASLAVLALLAAPGVSESPARRWRAFDGRAPPLRFSH